MERRTPLASRPPASTVVVLIVSPGWMWSTGAIAPEKTRWKAVGSKTCVFDVPDAAFWRRGLPGELVISLFDGAGDLIALHAALEFPPLLAVGAQSGDLQLIAVRRPFELQLIEGAGDLACRQPLVPPVRRRIRRRSGPTESSSYRSRPRHA